MTGNGAYAYRQTDIMTAEPKKLVLMCYEGAIGSLKQAIRQYEAEDYETKGTSVQRFQSIMNELLCGLDFEKGGQIATNLQSIYNYAIRRVLQADIARDIRGFSEVIELLGELKAAWEEISYGRREHATVPNVSPLSAPEKTDVQATMGGTYSAAVR